MTAFQKKRKYPVTVDAKDNTLAGSSTGARLALTRALQPGSVLSMWVDEEETWQLSSNRAYTADGNHEVPLHHPRNSEFEYCNGSLVGSLDDGQTFFPVGGWLQMGVPTAGNLTLYNWDDRPDDNKGQLTVVVGVNDHRADDLCVRRAVAAGWSAVAVNAFTHFSGAAVGKATGVSVSPGDILQVVASSQDMWTPRDRDMCNANGFGVVDGTPDHESVSVGDAFKFPLGALIGSLDGGKTYFFVGSHLEMTSLLPIGELRLYCADSNRMDSHSSTIESRRTITAYINVIKRGSYRGVLYR